MIFPRTGNRTSHKEEDGLPIQAQLGPHIDATSGVLQAAIYVDDVVPHGGGITVWPGSAQLLYPTQKQHRNFSPTAAFPPALDHVKRTIRPIEFAGSAGDVVFCKSSPSHLPR